MYLEITGRDIFPVITEYKPITISIIYYHFIGYSGGFSVHSNQYQDTAYTVLKDLWKS